MGSQGGARPRISKSAVRALLLEEKAEGLAGMAGEYRNLLGILLTLTYDSEPEVAWRAVEATGAVASRIGPRDPERVREHLRKLFWLITEESGGICWRAPETMAAIVGESPERFGEFVPIIVNLLREMADEDLEHFRPGILWAIGHLGPLARAAATDVLPAMIRALDHQDPRIRGISAWSLGRLGLREELAARPHLQLDRGELQLFEDGVLRRTTVGRTVQRFLSEEPERC